MTGGKKKANRRSGLKSARKSGSKIRRKRLSVLQRFRLQEAKARFERRQKRSQKKAYLARDAYKVRARDKGKLVMIGVKGQQSPQLKGRRGYLLYVTASGKKQLVKQPGKYPYKSHVYGELSVANNFRYRKKASYFYEKRVAVYKGRRVLRSIRKVKPGKLAEAYSEQEGDEVEDGYGNDLKANRGSEFDDKVVKTITRSLQRAMSNQVRETNLLISLLVLIRFTDNTKQVMRFEIPVDKRTRLSILYGGTEEYIRMAFYAHFARELAYMGYITSGSANHIRKSVGVKQITEASYNRYHAKKGDGVEWQAPRFEVVSIEQYEWKIEEAK